jgi:hypothetical protein
VLRGERIGRLRDTLWANRRVYFKGFECGFNALHPRRIEELIGSDYARLRLLLDEATDHRKKLFHGQLTSKWLGPDALLEFWRGTMLTEGMLPIAMPMGSTGRIRMALSTSVKSPTLRPVFASLSFIEI